MNVKILVSLGSDCAWDKDKDFPRYSPLILDSNFEFILPVEEDGNRVVRLASQLALLDTTEC